MAVKKDNSPQLGVFLIYQDTIPLPKDYLCTIAGLNESSTFRMISDRAVFFSRVMNQQSPQFVEARPLTEINRDAV